jgi:hypothetical protein
MHTHTHSLSLFVCIHVNSAGIKARKTCNRKYLKVIKIPPIEGLRLLKDIKIPPTYITYMYMLCTCVYWRFRVISKISRYLQL